MIHQQQMISLSSSPSKKWIQAAQPSSVKDYLKIENSEKNKVLVLKERDIQFSKKIKGSFVAASETLGDFRGQQQ